MDDLILKDLALDSVGPEIGESVTKPVSFGLDTPYPLEVLDTHTVRLWVKLNEDLEIEPLSDLGPLETLNHHLTTYLEDDSLDRVIRGYPSALTKVGNHEFNYGDLTWARKTGFMPNEPLQVEISVEFYTSHGPEGEEGDCLTGHTFITKPHNPESVEAYYEALKKAYDKAFERRARKLDRWHAVNKRGIETRADLLYLHSEVFWTENSYDEMAPPNARRIVVASRYNHTVEGHPTPGPSPYLASIEGPIFEPGLIAKLKAKLAEKYPQFAHLDLNTLPHPSHHLPPTS